MADTIKLDILTPLGPKRDGVEVTGVEIPGIEGELGVLARHEALVTAIVPGVVRFREGNQSTRIAVGSGFLEVKDDGRVVILVERALDAGEVDAAAAREGLGEVKKQLDHHTGSLHDPERRQLATQHAWLEAQLRAANPPG